MSERDEGVVRQDAAMWGAVARVLEAQARVEAMAAANEQRQSQGYAQAYGEESFFIQADAIANEARYLSSGI